MSIQYSVGLRRTLPKQTTVQHLQRAGMWEVVQLPDIHPKDKLSDGFVNPPLEIDPSPNMSRSPAKTTDPLAVSISTVTVLKTSFPVTAMRSAAVV